MHRSETRSVRSGPVRSSPRPGGPLPALLAALSLLAVVAPAAPAVACDICSVYMLLEARESRLGLYAGVFEQYADFSTLRLDGTEVDNDAGQYLRSSVTQVLVGYELGRRFGVQANVPLIDRSFRRPEEGGMETGGVSGVGDVAVVAHWRAIERYDAESAFVWTLLGGVELPTGDTDPLREELGEGHHDGGEEAEHDEGRAGGPGPGLIGSLIAMGAAHEDHGPASGVHGHDLALGSGAVDGLVGTSVFLSHRRFYTRAQLQYAMRTEGDFDYRYADDMTWSVEPGFFLTLAHDRTLGLGVNLSGEHKGEDSLAGERLDDTAIDAIYAGPAVSFSYRTRLFAELDLDLPVEQDNSALQIVPDSRLRLAVTWRF
jgi:hypothetical protein